MEEAKNRISAYLTDEELEKFNLQVLARGDVTVSGYIREMLGFDVRDRGRPPGESQQKAPQANAAETKPPGKEKKKRKRKRKGQLSFLDS